MYLCCAYLYIRSYICAVLPPVLYKVSCVVLTSAYFNVLSLAKIVTSRSFLVCQLPTFVKGFLLSPSSRVSVCVCVDLCCVGAWG